MTPAVVCSQQVFRIAVQMADVLREVQGMDGIGAEQLRATAAGKMVTVLSKELKGQPFMLDAAAAARSARVFRV